MSESSQKPWEYPVPYLFGMEGEAIQCKQTWRTYRHAGGGHLTCTFPSLESSSILCHYSPKHLHVTTKYLNYTAFKINEFILVPFLPVIAKSHPRTF